MLIGMRNAMMAGKRLPYDAEVEYLESTGTQWINMDVMLPVIGLKAIIGCSVPTVTTSIDTPIVTIPSARGFSLLLTANNSTKYFWIYNDNGGRFIIKNITFVADRRYDLEATLRADGATLSVDGSSGSATFTPTASTDNLWIFRQSNRYTIGRIFECKLYSGDTLVRDYIPVRKGTVGYLYDRVSGKLFGNAGTGDFVVGPDVVPVEYIESHGTEWIDTRYYLTNGTELEAVTQSTDGAQKNNTLIGCGTSSSSDDRVQLHLGSGVGVATVRIDGQLSNEVAVGTTTFTSRLDIRHKKAYINNQEVISSYNGSICTTRPVALFNRMIRDGVVEEQYGAKGRIYSVKIYDLGVLVRSFRPVRVGTDATSWEGAMMDVLIRRIYRNQGSGAFGYGNDI